jgi:L-ribulose-5-phosphate 3-epimerase
MRRIGIMQGRLIPPMDGRFQCFPRGRWAEEFPLAAEAGLQAIEWIYDAYGAEENPIASAAGIAQIKSLSETHRIGVFSVCADYFMDFPLVRINEQETQERLNKLFWLMRQGQALGIHRLVLPFVDASRIETEAEESAVVQCLTLAMPVAEETGVEIHLETSLAPAPFASLLSKVHHPMLKVNYDSGNSSSLGYHPTDEFAAYGQRVGSVHIKDRVLGGGTVPLGTGDADFSALFAALRKIEYSGDVILQVARPASGNEVAWAKQNLAFVQTNLGMEL